MQRKTAIANIVTQERVELILCFPNNAFIDAAAAAGIRPIVSRMERAAVTLATGHHERVETPQRAYAGAWDLVVKPRQFARPVSLLLRR